MGGSDAEGTLDMLMFHILIIHTCITNEPEEGNTCRTSEEDARQKGRAAVGERARPAVVVFVGSRRQRRRLVCQALSSVAEIS